MSRNKLDKYSNRFKRNRPLRRMVVDDPDRVVADPYKAIHKKFDRIRELRSKINEMRILYTEHDVLMESLLPYFVQTEADKFVILRQITLGTKTYRLTPFFFDEKKAQIRTKTWKSTAHETFIVQ